jgi:hypothetical protein
VLILKAISRDRVEVARARADISQGLAPLSELILPGRTGRMLRLPTA